MANFIYPNKKDLKQFIEIIREEKYDIEKYLPSTDEAWYKIISECIEYVEHTSQYDLHSATLHDASARLLYKVAKRHELGDGNKRSAVIVVYIFYILNDHFISSPQKLKVQAKRIASTKGRVHEDMMKKRIAESLAKIVFPFSK